MSLEDVPHEVRAALDAIAEERTRQLAVWGVQHLPNGTAASKANRAKRDSFRKITEWNAQRHTLTWDHVVTMLEHHGSPAIPFDIGKHTEFVCSSCGGSSFTGEFDLTR